MIWSRSTSDGMYDMYATSKKTVQIADEESDDEELRQGQHVCDVRDRDRREQRSPPEVAGDEDRTPRQPIDPNARRAG